MKLGYAPSTARILDLDEAFKLASNLGLDFVELSFDLHEMAPFLQDASRVRELTSQTGVGTTVHLSFVDLNLASLAPAARDTAVERTLRGLDYAASVDAACGVLHSGMHYVDHPQANAWVEDALADSLARVAAHGGPQVALENLALGRFDLLRGPDALAQTASAHGLGTCLDVGHAHVEETRDGGRLIEAYREALEPSLVHLHLHGNHGQADEHLPVGEGSIDDTRLQHVLDGFSGTACLEISGGTDAVGRAVSAVRGLQEAAA
jgi:sugar phosphate isomerase/epimerase